MAGVDESALIRTRREPGTRRPMCTRDQIASAALAGTVAEDPREVFAGLGRPGSGVP